MARIESFATVLVAGCLPEEPEDCSADDPPEVCYGQLVVDFDDGPVPVFRLEGGRIDPNHITVSRFVYCEDGHSGLDHAWEVRGLGASLRTGVAYGVAPDGAAVIVDPIPLAPEDTYAVSFSEPTPPSEVWQRWLRPADRAVEPPESMCPSWW